MGHPNFAKIMKLRPYKYWIGLMSEEQVRAFIVNESVDAPDQIDNLRQSLESFPEYHKFIKLLNIA
jgi:hypothetical protein